MILDYFWYTLLERNILELGFAIEILIFFLFFFLQIKKSLNKQAKNAILGSCSQGRITCFLQCLIDLFVNVFCGMLKSKIACGSLR